MRGKSPIDRSEDPASGEAVDATDGQKIESRDGDVEVDSVDSVADAAGGEDPNEPTNTDDGPLPEDRWWSAATVISGLAALALVAVCGIYAARFGRAMARTSLWTDELFTTRHFTAAGPINAITNYKTANNHVFHSVVTSLLPGDPRSPLRARFWPIAFTATSLLIVVVHFARRKQFLVGAVLVYCFTINFAWLDLSLQSRGYGPLALMALIAAVGVKRFLETERSAFLWMVTIPVVLGTWALPSYLFFAAPMLLGLLVITRSRAVLIHGVIAAGGVLLTYLPILSDLVRATRDYAEEFGGDNFVSLNQVGASFSTYLFQTTGFGRLAWLAATSVVVATLAALGLLILRKTAKPAQQFALLMFGSAVAFYAICLILRTPILRTTAFVMWPVAFGAATVVGEASRRARRPLLVSVASVAVVALLLPNAVSKARSFTFTPLENWEQTTDYLAAIVPDGSSVYATWSPEYADDYLSDRFTVVRKPNTKAFAAGRLVILDQPRPKTDPPDVSAAPFSVAIESKQRRFGSQRLVLPVPPDAGVERVTLDGEDRTGVVTDRDIATSLDATPARADSAISVEIKIDPGTPTRAVVLGASSFPASFRADITLADGTTVRLQGPQVIRQEGVVVLLIGDRALSGVTIGVEPTKSARAISVEELWVTPTVLPPA